MTDTIQNRSETEEEQVMFQERKRLVFLGLPWTFTRYSIRPSLVTVNQGFLRTVEDDCYMYKIQDVKLTRSLGERIFGLSTVICYTSDVTSPTLQLVHVKKGKEIKNYLLKASEAARIKRRTMHMMDISAHGVDVDGDGIPDSME